MTADCRSSRLPGAAAGLAGSQGGASGRGQPVKAVTAALEAIRRRYFLPQAHLLFDRALAAAGKWLAAVEALETLLRLQPAHERATAYLRQIRRHVLMLPEAL